MFSILLDSWGLLRRYWYKNW